MGHSRVLAVRRLPAMGIAASFALLVLLAFAGLMTLSAQPAFAAYPEVGTPPMSIGECTSCHTTYPTAHSLDNCASCHSYAIGDPHYTAQPRPITPAGSCLAGDYGCHTKGPQSAYVHGAYSTTGEASAISVNTERLHGLSDGLRRLRSPRRSTATRRLTPRFRATTPSPLRRSTSRPLPAAVSIPDATTLL